MIFIVTADQNHKIGLDRLKSFISNRISNRLFTAVLIVKFKSIL